MDLLTDDDDWQAGLLIGAPMPLAMKLVDNAENGLVEGYAATFSGLDLHHDTIVPGAFADSIGEHRAAGTAPAMLWNHRPAEPIGRWTAMGEDARGLRVRGQINLETTRGREAYAHVKAGDVDGLSIGYQVPPGGQRHNRDGSRALTKIRLHEVSVASVPSDPRARLTSVKSAVEVKSFAELESVLRDMGFNRGAARKLAAAGWPALSGEADTPGPDPMLGVLRRTLDRHALELKSLMTKGPSR
jgi:HK97 family phage prohead protease